MQFCFMNALLMRWQVIPANCVVFCNRSNFVIPRDHMLPRVKNDKKGKVFPYSLPSVGPGADPGVQAVSPQVT